MVELRKQSFSLKKYDEISYIKEEFLKRKSYACLNRFFFGKRRATLKKTHVERVSVNQNRRELLKRKSYASSIFIRKR